MAARRYGNQSGQTANSFTWNLSSSVHIDIERGGAANEWDIECEHEKINSISPSVHVLFYLLYKQESAIP